MTQDQLAKACGIKQGSLSAIEGGVTKEVSARVVILAARRLHVRVDWLWDETGPKEGDILSPSEEALIKAHRAAITETLSGREIPLSGRDVTERQQSNTRNKNKK